ncbi:MAG: hypothetical protein E3K37_00450 [Candidatus Kuenenia sp.]|nr:hypothetical protein [Candidatus Kuenenia hertensis]
MKRIWCMLFVLGVFVTFYSSNGMAEEEIAKKTLKQQMELKLEYVQEILEGIAKEDFSKVENGANKLVELCEIVGWTETKSKGQFKKHDKKFHEVAQELVTLARAQNLEGVHYKYNNLVMDCIDCHQHIRDVEAPDKYIGGVHEGEYLYKGKHVHSR